MTLILGLLRRGVAAFADDSEVSFGLKQQVNNSLVAVLRGPVERSPTVVVECVGKCFGFQKLSCNGLVALAGGPIARSQIDAIFFFEVCLRK